MKTLLVASVCILLLALSSFAQSPQETKTISGGVLNGKAKSLPKPVYPKGSTSIGGQVNVKVLIDETGKVVSAITFDGMEDPAFRQAAEAAALKAVFEPTTLQGRPAKVSGVIEYNFVPAKADYGEQLKLIGVGIFASTARSSISDLQKLNKEMESDDFIKSIADDIPAFAKEIPNTAYLEKMTVDQRLAAIDRVLASVRAGTNQSGRWQIDVGVSLGALIELFGASDDNFDPRKVDESAIKVELNKLKQLSDAPPAGFPRDVLAKLNALAAFGSRDHLLSPATLQQFMDAMADMFNTISPDVDK